MTTSRFLYGQHSRGANPVNQAPLFTVIIALVILTASPPARAGDDPAVIVIYNGLGTPRKARIWGRVLEDKGQAAPARSESWYRKLKRNYRAMESDEIPHARLELRVLGKRYPVKANKEGLFTLDIPGPLPTGRHVVTGVLKDKRKNRAVDALLQIWPSRPGVAVISDIDDTILATGVSSKVKMAKKVMFTNAHDLRSFKHAPALYRVWAARAYPMVFVSGSPVNLYTKLTRFMKLKGFPAAPLLLKDFGLKDLTEQKAYKLGQIKQALELLPGYRLLLVGDSGEQDPAIYAEVRKRHPRLVKAVMIHRVSGEKSTPAQFRRQRFFRSYRELARYLRKRGLLTRAELATIEKRP